MKLSVLVEVMGGGRQRTEVQYRQLTMCTQFLRRIWQKVTGNTRAPSMSLDVVDIKLFNLHSKILLQSQITTANYFLKRINFPTIMWHLTFYIFHLKSAYLSDIWLFFYEMVSQVGPQRRQRRGSGRWFVLCKCSTDRSHATQGHVEIHRLVKKHEWGHSLDHILYWVSVGKARQGRVNSLRLVSLNHCSVL